MAIKVWDYTAEYEAERENILAAVDRVFRSGVLILGESGRNFEAEFSSYCGVAHGVGVDNATNGLFLALRALGIGAGDEVITVANTAVPTVSAIVQAGATPVFVDIDPGTRLMAVDLVREKITPRTKCVIPVHLFGQCVRMEDLLAVCAGAGIKIIEDCSQSHGATRHGQKAGSFGDLGVFSFYPTKPLGAYGDGGMVVTKDESLDAKLRRLRFYGMSGTYYAEEPGYNSRLDEVQAEILREKLKRLDAYIARRQHLAARYNDLLAGTSLGLPIVEDGNEHVYYVYVVDHPDRDRIIADLKRHEIFVNISYPWPIHTMRGYAYLGGREGDLPHTEAAASRIFSLPMFPALSEHDQDRVCQVLGAILAEPVSV